MLFSGRGGAPPGLRRFCERLKLGHRKRGRKVKAEGITEKLWSESGKLKAEPKGILTAVLKVIAESGAER